MISYEFCKIFKNTFFTEHLCATPSEHSIQSTQLQSAKKSQPYTVENKMKFENGFRKSSCFKIFLQNIWQRKKRAFKNVVISKVTCSYSSCRSIYVSTASVLNCVPRVVSCPTYFTCVCPLRANVLYVLTRFTCLCAFVPSHLMCLPFLRAFRAIIFFCVPYVPSFFTCLLSLRALRPRATNTIFRNILKI